MLDNAFVLGDLKLPADKGRLPCPLWVASGHWRRHPRLAARVGRDVDGVDAPRLRSATADRGTCGRVYPLPHFLAWLEMR